jgi:site-specific DNA-methyltransferase (adenine-specific)
MIEPSYQSENVTLYQGDCLTVLPTLDGQVDAIITDLPYGTTACAWDNVIPFEPMWVQVKRLLKPRGVFVTTASQPFTSKLVMSNLGWFKYEWIWDKHSPTGFLNSQKAPLKQHENICIFSENGHNYNPQKEHKEYKAFRRKTDHVIKSDPNGIYGDINLTMRGRTEYRYPKSIIKIKWGGGWSARIREHPTQKPVALYEYLIRTYTNEGDTVLDFCMGSGTTGVAAVQLGRRFIGIEIDPTYFAIAAKRIKQAQQQIIMPLDI